MGLVTIVFGTQLLAKTTAPNLPPGRR